MNLNLRNSIQDYKNKSKPYYIILNDFKNHVLQIFQNYIEMYKIKQDREYLNKLINSLNSCHKEFNDLSISLITVMKKEGVKEDEQLFILINKLKKLSNFDWSNFRRIEKFFKVYSTILQRLKKLP